MAEQYKTSNFQTLGDELRDSEICQSFVRRCCIQKQNVKEEDLYINENWDRPKTGKIREEFKHYKYEFRNGHSAFYDIELKKRKPCCKVGEVSRKKVKKGEDKAARLAERVDCFYCECSHCTAFHRQILAKHKIPFMAENRSQPSSLTAQRQYHSRKTWRDEYGLRKG